VIVGFVGVLVILSDYVGPEASTVAKASTLGAIIAVVSAFLGATATTQVRAMVQTEAASTIVLYFSLFCALAGLISIPFTPWSVPGPVDAAMLVGAGIFGGIGQVTMTQSFRHADASLIAPFDYTSMIWALIVSLAVFNTWPSGIMLVGTAIVIGAGLFVIYREHRLGIERRRSKEAQTPTTTTPS
jgi:drug/metabolite transporter (DMT)-like permease